MPESEMDETGKIGAHTVLPEDVLRKGLPSDSSEAETSSQIRVLLPIQRVGFYLALCVFGYIVVASFMIYRVSFRPTSCSAPQAPITVTVESLMGYKDATSAYKECLAVERDQLKSEVDRAVVLYQAIVASTILPAFTAILGYIFGSKSRED